MMYFTDCTDNRAARAVDCNTVNAGTGTPASSRPLPNTPTPGPVAKFFDRILPDGRAFCIRRTLQLFSYIVTSSRESIVSNYCI